MHIGFRAKHSPIMIVFLLLVLSLITTGVFAQQPPRQYTAVRALSTPLIDGKADDNAWSQAAWSEPFIDIEGIKKPRYATRMKMVWDSMNLYILAELEEPHLWGTLKQRDTVIFYNNDFEVFIDPDGDTHNYMELEVNLLNTQWDLLLTKPYRNQGKVYDSWDITGLETAISYNGTLNDPSDQDQGWSIEIALPWQVLTEAAGSGKVPEGEFWRIGFSRVNWDFDISDGRYSRKRDKSGKYLPEYNWVWSPQWVINMHEPEKWGYVYFEPSGQASDADVDLPVDEPLKWELYRIYREVLQEKQTSFPIQIEYSGSQLEVSKENHSSGWNLMARSPHTGNLLVIKEDGKFLTYENQ